MMNEENNPELSARLVKLKLEFRSKYQAILDVIVVLVVSAVAFKIAFSNYAVMSYIDGGYYFLEVKALVENGKLYYEAPPLFFIIAYFFSIMSNIEIGLRIASALIVAIQVPSFFVALKMVKGRTEAYLTLPFTLWNATFYHMFGNLSKNLIGLAFIPILLALTWKIWLEKKKLAIKMIALFVATLLLTISHLPATLVGVMSTGILILIIVLKVLLSDWKRIGSSMKNASNLLKQKNYKALLDYQIVRIAVAGILMGLSLLLGVIINNNFPHFPDTWYSSSDLPSENYGNNTDVQSMLLLSNFLVIILREQIIVLILLALLILFRPKAWELPLAVFLAISGINFAINSQSWVSRLTLDLEVGRILLLAIVLGALIDLLAKLLSKIVQSRLLKGKKHYTILKLFSAKSLYSTAIALVVILTFSIINARLLTIQPDRFMMNEQFIEEYEQLGDYIKNADNESNPIVFTSHGEEYWFTVATDIEAQSSTDWNDFVTLMKEMTNYKERSVYLLYPSHSPPVIGTVPIIRTSGLPITGTWGQIVSPLNISFIGDSGYNVKIILNYPLLELKSATLKVWQLNDAKTKHLIHTETLQMGIQSETQTIVENNPSILSQICSKFGWMLLSININFVNSSVLPLKFSLAVYGGVAPFTLVHHTSFYNLYKLNTQFSLDESYATPYPSFSAAQDIPRPPHQPDNQIMTSRKPFFLDFLSPVLLWPFLLSANFYIKLLVALPLTIAQAFILLFVLFRNWTLKKQKGEESNVSS